MSMMNTSTALMTAEELLQLPRGHFRAELINGELRKLGSELAPKLDPYVRAKYLELEEAVRKSDSSQEK